MGNSESSTPVSLCYLSDKGQGLYETNNNISNKSSLCCQLPVKLKQGDRIIITGTTLPTFKSFSVNLSQDNNIDKDCVLHFNPRFRFNSKCTDGQVVMNYKKNSKWRKEERWLNMPFNTNQPFVIEIAVTKQSYVITIDDSPFYAFNHRVDMHEANFIYISGDVSISSIQLFNSDTTRAVKSAPPAYFM
ncbi:galectin-6 [Biomphalaria glabrata]|uniref:Galectin n=1 Tax=Biomphalaria glabrata TaxID=6526 RepID=A0A2C9KPL0_BIOGL|nr:galectin-6 [Biomphalaria glabrata]KAI8747504.1 galectin-6-like [Biomphalaria glabrata]